MPVMARPLGKAKKIAFKILGVPSNMIKQHTTEEQRRLKRRLLFEETTRVR